ncbi:MAG: outer membrane protein assembly factor BamD, partial [Candidatus Competibacteraceae bacterium]
AIAAADRFIRTFPRHPFVDYAYYMKGLINYSRDASLINRVVPSDPAKTDPGTAKQSFDDFAELVRKFPDSTYAEDARQRMVFLHNNLAAYEVNVADYYMRRGAYVAAANRAKYVLENYARTEAVPDALAVMTHAYVKLGLQDLAADSLRVLRANYPSSPHIPELIALLNGEDIETSSFSLFGLSL